MHQRQPEPNTVPTAWVAPSIEEVGAIVDITLGNPIWPGGDGYGGESGCAFAI